MFSNDVIKKVQGIAADLHVEPAALLAVAEVESAGVPFWRVGGKNVPAIRFEGHYFYRILKGNKLKKAVAAGLANPKAGAVKNPSSYSARYALLERARAIDPDAADCSTSWGLGQVMGDHYKKLGFKNVKELVANAGTVDGQIDIMARYIKKFGLVDELQRKGWADFARQYNGSNYKSNRYDTKMAAAYKTYTRMLAHGSTSPVEGTDSTVMVIQRDLKRLGYYKGKVDGIEGVQTKAAVKAFQKTHGLVADGKYGKMTDEAVDREIAALDAAKGDTAVKTGTGITGTGAVVDIVKEQADQLSTVSYYSQIITYVVVGLVVAGVALTLYGLWKKYRTQGV